MTIRTESRIQITGSIQEVWAYVCDVGRWPEWAPTGSRMLGSRRRADPARLAGRSAGEGPGRTHGRSQEVTAVEAPRHVAFAGRQWVRPRRAGAWN